MEFNAKNLKKITDEAREEKQIKLAHELFDKLQQRALEMANAGMGTAELTDLESSAIDETAMRVLRELFGGTGIALVFDDSTVPFGWACFIKWST